MNGIIFCQLDTTYTEVDMLAKPNATSDCNPGILIGRFHQSWNW